VSETTPQESENSSPPPASEVAVVAERRPRYGRWVLLLVVIVAAGFGWQQWQQWNRQQITAQQTNAWQRDADALNDRIEDLAVALDRLARNQKSIETRAGDNAATNRVLREELLGMGERAALLEDAIGRMADPRLRGARPPCLRCEHPCDAARLRCAGLHSSP
jgi:uroporphyrin-3 C-methyltransferase